mmetsp:Transcript_6871/g.21441  ORF Transcript_6871/g.21441 Transcript_6871/m.21441 type:complete len:137 (+) Transcript_6871:201-611(+)
MPAGVDVWRVFFAVCSAVGLLISEAEGDDDAPATEWARWRRASSDGDATPVKVRCDVERDRGDADPDASAEATSVAVDCPSITGGEKWAAPRPPLSAVGDPPLACETAELGRKVWPANWASLADPAARESKMACGR